MLIWQKHSLMLTSYLKRQTVLEWNLATWKNSVLMLRVLLAGARSAFIRTVLKTLTMQLINLESSEWKCWMSRPSCIDVLNAVPRSGITLLIVHCLRAPSYSAHGLGLGFSIYLSHAFAVALNFHTCAVSRSHGTAPSHFSVLSLAPSRSVSCSSRISYSRVPSTCCGFRDCWCDLKNTWI